MDLNMSKEPRQNLVKPQLIAEDSKKIGDRSVPTLRITISLTESTKSNCPELNYIELSTSKQNENKSNLDPFSKELTQEDEEIRKIAESFNEKYGASKKKNKRKIFMGLGEGYNLEDSFIDDDDAYEEEIPWEYDPLHVGYYINKGTLLCTNQSIPSTPKNDETRKPGYRAPNDNDDEEEEDVILKEEMKGRKKMRILDDDDKLEIKKRRIQLTEVKKDNSEGDIKNNANVKSINTPVLTVQNNDAKCIKNINTKINKNLVKNNKVNNGNSKENEMNTKLIEELKGEIIEEFNKMKMASESPDSNLKHLFSNVLLNKLSRIYALCQSQPWKTKMRVFESLSVCSGVQREVIFKRVKKHCIDVNRQKGLVAKNKLKQGVDEAIGPLLQKYKEEVAERNKLRQEMKAAMSEAKQDGVEPSSGDSNDAKGEVKAPEIKNELKKSSAPRKKFIWTASIREMLQEVVSIHMQYYEITHIKSQSAEDFLKAFFESELLSIWPPGWMQSRILMKESKPAHIKWTADPNRAKAIKMKKQQKSSSITVQSNTAVIASANINNNVTIVSTANINLNVTNAVTVTSSIEKHQTAPTVPKNVFNSTQHLTSPPISSSLPSQAISSNSHSTSLCTINPFQNNNNIIKTDNISSKISKNPVSICNVSASNILTKDTLTSTNLNNKSDPMQFKPLIINVEDIGNKLEKNKNSNSLKINPSFTISTVKSNNILTSSNNSISNVSKPIHKSNKINIITLSDDSYNEGNPPQNQTESTDSKNHFQNPSPMMQQFPTQQVKNVQQQHLNSDKSLQHCPLPTQHNSFSTVTCQTVNRLPKNVSSSSVPSSIFKRPSLSSEICFNSSYNTSTVPIPSTYASFIHTCESVQQNLLKQLHLPSHNQQPIHVPPQNLLHNNNLSFSQPK